MASWHSSLAVLLGLAGCCLEVVSPNGTTSSGSGTSGSGSTSGGMPPCAVPENDPTTNVTTLAGNGIKGFFDGSGGRNGGTEFSNPAGVVTDIIGNVYVADASNARIRRVDPSGNTTTFAGNGTAQLSAFALTVDGAGNLLVVGGLQSQIHQVDPSGKVTTLPATGTKGEAFRALYEVALDRSGHVLVSDPFNFRICKFDRLDVLATVLAEGTWDHANGLDGAGGIAVDVAGNVYFADWRNHVIRRIDPSGTLTTFTGDGRAGFADGPSGSAEFYQPQGLAIDPAGNLIVADSGGNRIRRVDPAGNVTTVAGNGGGGPDDDDGTGGASGTATFFGPSGVTVDSACNVYVTDGLANRIRKITFGVPPH